MAVLSIHDAGFDGAGRRLTGEPQKETTVVPVVFGLLGSMLTIVTAWAPLEHMLCGYKSRPVVV